MDCEICGKETNKGKLVMVEGTMMTACAGCASFGKEVEKPREGPVQSQVKILTPPNYREDSFDIGLEIVPDYGKIIRQAREQKGLTTKELAMKIFEKESLLHRYENQAIKPSDAIIGKLEKQLGIKLKQKLE